MAVLPQARGGRRPRRSSRRSVPTQVIEPRRLLTIWLLLVLGAACLGWRLFTVQVLEGPTLRQKAAEQQQVTLSPFLPRRPIIDQQGNLLALDQEIYTLYVHPRLFKEPIPAVAEKLAPILGMDKAALQQRFQAQESGIRLRSDLSRDTVSTLRGLYLDGLEFEQRAQRLYPFKDLYANIVGFLNDERKGQAGLEFSQQNLLQRPVLKASVERSGDGSLLPDGVPAGFLHQDDMRLQLTLDGRLQRTTQTVLRQQLKRYSAKRGAAIVMDVRDGSLLALVSEPTYDANRYYEADPKLFNDWAVHDLYEPGSTFKPINIAIALEEKVLDINDVIYDEGRIQVGGWPINNHDYSTSGGRGPLSLEKVMQYSSNVAMVHIMDRLRPQRYFEWLQKLQIDKAVGTDLPFATAGQIKARNEFVNHVIEPATASFGQGFSLTPLKLLQLHAAIANGGKLVTPHVIAGLVDSQGQLYWQPPRPEAPQLFSAETSKQVMSLMESVVVDGSGKPAQIKGYRLGGKTGTAQKAENGMYVAGARITSFVGVLPADNPRYAILVVVDEPRGDDAYGSTVAAPVVKQMAEALVAIEGLAPT
ncbi:peptidoglycan D,D-transpeptidase FtsI family protein [Synechococcus elongatus]|uniref:Penicillin-binding protein 2 n=1 Tax=Synechococcus elongatus PCC 11801 TaxID=2219813 RepID=A0AAN1QLN5_SYNEL|nr:penicillin-binding protein 2 [Synechococcus elongatus]AZB71533.1 penicillin-binding protein 2 [Synechococcus elongatus PCC 11801]